MIAPMLSKALRMSPSLYMNSMIVQATVFRIEKLKSFL